MEGALEPVLLTLQSQPGAVASFTDFCWKLLGEEKTVYQEVDAWCAT